MADHGMGKYNQVKKEINPAENLAQKKQQASISTSWQLKP
jgi:hypothetical protein